MDKFVVKKYEGEQYPIIKGNGFDGLEVGQDREDAEAFILFVNNIMDRVKELELFQEQAFEAHPNLDLDIEILSS